MSETVRASASQWAIAAQWFERAAGDLRIAETIVVHNADTIWGAAFNCQQALEKLAEGILVAVATEPPKIHDIEVLADLVEQQHAGLGAQISDLAGLIGWYFAARYPGGIDASLPSLEEVKDTIQRIRRLRRQVGTLAPKS